MAGYRRALALGAAALLVACDDARDRVNQTADEVQAAADAALGAARAPRALDLLELARRAFDLLDLVPRYTCGEPRPTFAARVADGIRLRYPCAIVTVGSTATADVVTASFPAPGCSVRGHGVVGDAVFAFTGGTDRMELAADLRALVVDGRALGTQAGYRTCGSETTYWAVTDGALEGGRTGHLDASVAVRSGLPVIGDTVLVVDATGRVVDGSDVDEVTAHGLEYAIGEPYPRSGKVTVRTGGHTLEITFARESCVGKVTVRVDGRLPVTVPLP